MNPGKAIDPFPLNSNLRLGPGYRAAPARHEIRLSRRRRVLRPCDDPLRRRRQMPPASSRRGGDVPQLSRDRRGEAFDPRPRPPPPRDGAGRGDQGRMAELRGRGGAFPVPRLQGLQARLPGRRRRGDLQSGVSRASLSGAAAPARRLFHGAGPLWSRAAEKAPRAANWLARGPLSRARQWLGGIAPAPRCLPSPGPVPRWFRAHRPSAASGDRRPALAGHVQQPFPPRDGDGGDAAARAAGFASPSRSGRSAAGGRSTIGACSIARGGSFAQTLENLADDIAQGTPLVVLEPACASVSRTSC